MNLVDMLPFLDGWTPFVEGYTKTVQRGQYITVLSRPIKGWLQGLDVMSNDAFGSMRIIYLGNTALATAEGLFVAGATMPVSAGSFLSLYLRPSVLSTAGVFCLTMIASAYPYPVHGLVRVELGLELNSTQLTAIIGIVIVAIEVTDEPAFVRSVRRFMYGWISGVYDLLSHLPGLKDVGLPDEVKEILDIKEKKK